MARHLGQGSTPRDAPARIVSPAVWRGDQLPREGAWGYELAESDLDELRDAVAAWRASGLSLVQISPEIFRLGRFAKTLMELFTDVLHGRGFAYLRGFPVEEFGRLEAIAAYIGIGRHLGSLRSQNRMGHILGHVYDIGLNTSRDLSSRGYQVGGPMKFHTDSVDVVGLLCLQPAVTGGSSKVASVGTIFNEISERRPDLRAALLEAFPRDYRGEGPTEKQWWEMPVFQWHRGNLFCHYSPDYIRSAQRFTDAPRLTEKRQQCLDLIDEIANEEGLYVSMPFAKGDIQFLNNHLVVHAREDYLDTPLQRRHLLRLWICPPHGLELPPAYAQRYGSLEIGNRGGIPFVGDPQVPLDPE